MIGTVCIMVYKNKEIYFWYIEECSEEEEEEEEDHYVDEQTSLNVVGTISTFNNGNNSCRFVITRIAAKVIFIGVARSVFSAEMAFPMKKFRFPDGNRMNHDQLIV